MALDDLSRQERQALLSRAAGRARAAAYRTAKTLEHAKHDRNALNSKASRSSTDADLLAEWAALYAKPQGD